MSFLRRKNKTWHIIEVVNGKPKERSLKTTDKRTAEDYWHNHEQNKARLNLGLASKNVPIHSVVEKYQEIHKAAPTKERDAGTFKNFFRLCPIEKLEEFTDETVQRFIARRKSEDGVENSTINRDLTTLKHFSKMLRRWKYTVGNPLEDVADLKEMETDTKFFTTEQINLILKHSRGMWHDMFVIAINTGCRENELLSLRWEENIDLNGRTIMIQAPKTKKIRYVPMTVALHSHLAGMRARNATGPVIRYPDGTQPRHDVITLHWTRLLKKLGIKKRGLSFRNTRHTYATHLRAAKEDISNIKDLLGHSTLAMTARYAKMNPDRLRQAVSKISYGRAPATHRR